MPNEILPSVTLAIAVVGATLGVINTWNTLERQRVKLLVRPAYGIQAHSELLVLVEVINLSSFAVTINEIGFSMSDSRKAISPEKLTSGEYLPVRLESRASITASFPLSALPPSNTLGKAFAATSCGEIVFGDSPALRQIRDGRAPKG